MGTTPRTRSLPRITAALAASALFFAACGDDDEAADLNAEQPVDEAVEEDLENGLSDEVADESMTEDEMAEDEAMGEGAMMMETQLDSLNESGVTGTTSVEINDDGTVTVTLETEGFVGGNPHAQHLHIGGNNECPTMEDAGEDGILTTAEGVPSYGEVMVSLTTEGDVGADSALAVERFPVADDSGMVTYERTFELPSGVTTDDLGDAVVVQHGLASMGGDETAYDGDMQSSLDPSLPLEATIPVACGPLSMQQG